MSAIVHAASGPSPDDPAAAAIAHDDPVTAARASMDAGRLHEAKTLLTRRLEESPRDGFARALAGLVAYLEADFEGALRELALAVELEPLHFEGQYALAFTLASLARWDDACRAFRRVLALDPGCSIARVRLAEILVATGARDEAVRCLEEGRARGLAAEEIEAVLAITTSDPASEGNAARVVDASNDDASSPAGGAGSAHESPATSQPPASAGPACRWVNPRDLVHARRFDVAAKHLYARALLGLPPLHSGYDAEDVYLRHIQFRTGGAEPGDEARKGSLASFTLQFARLLASMKANGFDPSAPIPVARRTGLLLNGAHRLAAALALGVERVPVIDVEGVDGLTWDFDWFVSNGFAPFELDEITRAWIDLEGPRAGTILLWPAAIDHWDAIEEEIGARVAIACRREIELPAAAFGELVRDVYATDWGPEVGENIERKVAFLAGFRPRARLLVARTSEDPRELGELKREIRERWSAIVPADRFATLHTTESPRETAHVTDLVLGSATLAALRGRPAGGLRSGFLGWMRDYHAALGRLKIDPEHCCVVGSAVLEALGVRQATDLDFTVTHALRRRRFTPGVTHVTKELDVVAQDYPRVIARAAAPTDDDLIRDRALHFRVRGLKFAALDVVLDRKLAQRRPKDLADAELVGRMRLAGRL
jgi:Flp pilus assembly protein TadD